MANKKVQVDIVGDAKSYTKATDDAVKASQSMASKMKASVMQGLGMGVGFGVFGLMTRGIGMVTDALGDSITAAREDQASVERLSASLKANVVGWDGNTDAIEANILAKQRLGFDDETLRDSLTVLTGATHDVTRATQIMNTAMDLARFKKIDLRTASEALIKVEGGHYRSLAQLGIKLRQNATSEEALAAVQKVAAGQAETYAKTGTGAAEAFEIKLSELKESMGQLLTGPADTFVGFLSDLASSLLPESDAAVKRATDYINKYGVALDEAAEAGRDLPVPDAMAVYTQAYKDWMAVNDQFLTDIDRSGMTLAMMERLTMKMAQATGVGAEELAVLAERVRASRAAVGDMVPYDEFIAALQELIATGIDFRAMGMRYATTLDDMGDATEETGWITERTFDAMAIAIRRLGHAGDTVGEDIRTDLEPIAGIVKGTLEEAKDEARAGMADLNWALTHPLAGEKLERFYRRQLRKAYGKLQEAQDTGNVIAIAKAQAMVDGIRGKLSELESVRISIQTNLDYRAENRSSGGRRFEYRASGGPVSAGQPYIVGEKRAELFVPNASGTILPSVPMRQGGGSTVVNIYAGAGTDPTELGRVVTRALRSYGQAGGGPAMKAAIGVG